MRYFRVLVLGVVLVVVGSILVGCPGPSGREEVKGVGKVEEVSKKEEKRGISDEVKGVIEVFKERDPIYALSVYFNEKEYEGDKVYYDEENTRVPEWLEEAVKRSTIGWYRLLKNEIYARRGYKFKDSLLARLFSGCSWYRGSMRIVNMCIMR